MSNNERIYRIDQLLNDRKMVSFQELLERLEVSPATLKRDLAYMRDRLNAPIVYDKELKGYRFDSSIGNYALPGLWFSPEEIYALLAMEHLLSNIDGGGILGSQIKPLRSRLLALLDSTDNSIDEIKKRVRVERIGARKLNCEFFQEIGMALIKRKKILLDYRSRSKNEKTNRTISPQRIIYYKDNWYLDAWCHEKNALRSFSLDAIQRVELLEDPALDLEETELDRELSSGYGIFAGTIIDWARLAFSPERARWVSHEKWHPEQKGNFLADGSYELRVPYTDERELIMEILRHGSQVRVLEPISLRVSVIQEINRMTEQY